MKNRQNEKSNVEGSPGLVPGGLFIAKIVVAIGRRLWYTKESILGLEWYHANSLFIGKDPDARAE